MSQKDFREVAVAIIEFAEAIDEAKVGGFKLTDIATFAGPALKLPAAYEGWEDGVAYFKSLDDAGRQVEIDFVANELDLESDKLEFVIEQALETVNSIYKLVELLKS